MRNVDWPFPVVLWLLSLQRPSSRFQISLTVGKTVGCWEDNHAHGTMFHKMLHKNHLMLNFKVNFSIHSLGPIVTIICHRNESLNICVQKKKYNSDPLCHSCLHIPTSMCTCLCFRGRAGVRGRGPRGEGQVQAEGLSLPLIYFCPCCFLSIAMHHLTLPKQAGAAQHQLKAIWVRSAAARRIRLALFRLLWNAAFFNIQNTQGSQIADMCVGPGEILHSFMPFYAKLFIVYLKNTEHFSTIKKHVI